MSHSFPLNFNGQTDEVVGTAGVAQVYRNALQVVKLSGPTYFTPILTQFLDSTKARMASNIYSVMLLLTDGEIFDMPSTIQKVVEASQYPCSIVIVGVGDEDFEKMEALDCDKGSLRD